MLDDATVLYCCSQCGADSDQVEITPVSALEERIPYFHGDYICEPCLIELREEFNGDRSNIYRDESEEDYWDHENEDGPYGSPD